MSVDRDKRLLADILDYGRECLAYLAGVERTTYLESRTHQLVTERLVHIIGEAARGLSSDAQRRISHDWRGLFGLRNILAHQYGDVNPEILWEILQHRLPALVEAVERDLGSARTD